MRAERDSLLLLLQQKDVGGLESTEELLSRVASVSQERDQLLEALGALREEKQQLRAELEDRMETVCGHRQCCVAGAHIWPKLDLKISSKLRKSARLSMLNLSSGFTDAGAGKIQGRAEPAQV